MSSLKECRERIKRYPRGPLLLIDGDESTREDFVRELSDAGFYVINCEQPNRIETLIEQQQSEWPVQIVLVDVILPSISGFEVVRRLSGKLNVREVPIIMMSKYKQPEDRLEAFNSGAHGFLAKPVTVEQVLDQIEVVKKKNRKAEISAKAL